MRLVYHENLFCQIKPKNVSTSDFTVNTTLIVYSGDLAVFYDNAA
jgi:hypothetical protein